MGEARGAVPGRGPRRVLPGSLPGSALVAQEGEEASQVAPGRRPGTFWYHPPARPVSRWPQPSRGGSGKEPGGLAEGGLGSSSGGLC